MLDRFKCKLGSATMMPSNQGSKRLAISLTTYSLSKRKIYFNRKDDVKSNEEINRRIIIHYGQTYTLIRITKDDFTEWSKNAQFQADLNGVQVAIITDIWNGILLRIIHKRYWMQKNWDWFIKAIIYIILGAAIGSYYNNKGFDKGYSKGSEDMQEKLLKKP